MLITQLRHLKKEKAVNFVKWVTLEEENAIKALEIEYLSINSIHFDSDYFKNTKMSFGNQKIYFDVVILQKCSKLFIHQNIMHLIMMLI